ncbi:hypothetical protein EN828_23640 [Mesorhizobium sp. M2D.F.Ca.ET.185.01.1.1]|uniref:hypothetical protein n=1 Tax=unclassified Mesorhizobium TaxID=325217 RepID=UPI000FC9F1C3|nr:MULTISPECIES: hypothetical protein [unclassified Mesorhizobium]TGP77169.1 hypothetical protein EN870_21435 [bacterium M00.F.Ca.ET.227.01.1.1]TGP84539.1 hypothetical protein EN864_30150 [bacterium M00.F.Ca.ET.221.01.1.1]TGP88686.1 hypothetical protein EN865_27090 [bacterium M00.F.Ca.ET.222.01.1.1]TGU30917.1 hypothetical protein EN799_31500 [bacterium M00.F.Ca.ET.156.01.1.1]TGU45173.1 hypothetical protein EN789_21275 [bacterium M00.F.Ca.ET.146.01.1.1]TGV65513.1 hypothetical protein EN803_308
MSHLLFVLVLAFMAWRWFAKAQGGAKDIRPGRGRAASRRSSKDDEGDEIADAAKAVSSFLGEKGFLGETGLLGKAGGELLGQAVSRALQESGVAGEIERRAAEVIKPIRQARQSAKKAAAQAQGKQRVKYLLDGDGGFRQRTDRTARLQQSFRGKGLCSPR